MNETLKGSEFNDINIDNINENILKMQGQEQESLGDQSIDLSQSNFDFNSKNIQLIENINSLIANSGKAGANQHATAEQPNENTDMRDIRRQFLSFAVIQKNSAISNVIFVVRKGIIYILNQSASELLQQVNTCSDIMKLMTSQQNEHLGAF